MQLLRFRGSLKHTQEGMETKFNLPWHQPNAHKTIRFQFHHKG